MTDQLVPTELRAADLLLRPWRPDSTSDAEAVLRGFTDPEFQRWNTPQQPIETFADAQAMLQRQAQRWMRGEQASYCVTDAASGAVLGHVSLNSIQPPTRSAAVGYWVLPEARGRGVAPRALELISTWGFGTAGLHRIELDHAVGHELSCRVAKRCGYLYEGTLRGAMFESNNRNAFRDAHLHARLAGDGPAS
ncbi:GNAT family N-acetyltransferase [Streptomyces apocyni]|uniref:GNAT family N-acetyltransferase n=1 Tax=Streptomyces apocyni TaxID=2654677 RepID=UPI0012E9B820|nr:GNAT family N-acetyltransferase [Streptomyces apocyni]